MRQIKKNLRKSLSEVGIVLASTSPRRIELFEQVQLSVQVFAPESEELRKPNEPARKLVARLAAEKAESVRAKVIEKLGPSIIIGADTVVVTSGIQKILGKPSSVRDAEKMLRLLAGGVHTVLTGYHIVRVGCGRSDKSLTRVVQSRVKMRKLSAKQISAYVRSQEPMDKAGSYAAQGIGTSLIEEIKGSYTNVVGLPVAQVLMDLEIKFHVSLLSWLK